MEKEKDHNEIIRAIGRLEGTVGGIDKKITDGFGRIDEQIKDHSILINTLMSERDQRKGGTKLIVGMWAGISAFGVFLLEHFFFRK